MLRCKDQLNRMVELPGFPKRIISLVPSQTELLFYLGLEAEVIGITKFCVHPEHWFRNKTRVGGTKTVNINIIASLHPDLIIANKEENVKEQIELLEKIAPVWISDVNNIEDAFNMMQSIGEMTGKKEKAAVIITQIKKDFAELALLINQSTFKKYRTAYLIWKDPYMAIGGDTFIHAMIKLCGLENISSDINRYPEITILELKEKNTELILLSSEPYPFKQKHIDELLQVLPDTKILLADGEIFSWYGSRMLQATPYIKKLLEQIHQ